MESQSYNGTRYSNVENVLKPNFISMRKGTELMTMILNQENSSKWITDSSVARNTKRVKLMIIKQMKNKVPTCH